MFGFFFFEILAVLDLCDMLQPGGLGEAGRSCLMERNTNAQNKEIVGKYFRMFGLGGMFKYWQILTLKFGKKKTKTKKKTKKQAYAHISK